MALKEIISCITFIAVSVKILAQKMVHLVIKSFKVFQIQRGIRIFLCHYCYHHLWESGSKINGYFLFYYANHWPLDIKGFDNKTF